jgi:peptide/nickel transport system substrate-binding protein
MTFPWRKAACVLAAATAVTLAAAGSTTNAAGDPPLVVDVPLMISIDPAFANLPGTWELEYATALKLVNYPDKAGVKGERPVPEASAYPVVSANRRTWTFHVKKGLKFSDGSTVDAHDFVWSYDRLIWLHSPAAGFLSDVVGYQAVKNHQQQTAPGIAVVGDAVVFTLSKPDNGLPLQLATNYFSVLPEGTPFTQLTDPFPSAGPYVVQSFDAGHEAVLVPNPNYQGGRPVHLDSIVLRQANQAQATQDAKTGAVDLVLDNDLLESALKGLKSAGTLQAHPTLETDYIALNTSRPLFRSTGLRRAFNFAIDRPAMSRLRGAYAGQRTDQILPPGMPGFRDAKLYPVNGPNVAQASKLAAPRCSRKHRCHGVFLTCNVGDCVSIAKVVKKDLARIGVDLKVESVDGQTFYTRLHRKGEPFDAVIASWNAGYADPFDFIDPLVNGHTLHSPSNANFSFLNNPSVNKALAADKKLLGPARYQAYGSLDIDITAKSAPWASYDNANEREFVSKHVKSYVFQPVYGGADLAAVQIK